MEKNISTLLNILNLEEKAALVAGTNFMYTNPVPRLGIRSIRMSDGPHGLRVQKEGGDNGVSQSEPSTAFPTAALTACGWNEENLYKMGQAMAHEAKYYGIDVILGPGVNIKRNPLGGRNFEYFSEDPFLTGKLGAAEVKGIQEENIGVSCKHFALNNAENYRFLGNSICDERAMREIYLKPFEIVVKEAKPQTVMCAYNQINGTYCSENHFLLTDVLRKEWGFNGLVMTDWGATHNRIKMLEAGLDLEMPGDTNICRKWIIDGIREKRLSMDVLDKAVRNVLNLVEKHPAQEKKTIDFHKHAHLSYEIASDCAVLLKNDDGILPLKKEGEVFITGELFEKMRYQGAGSSMINPVEYITPKTAFDNHQVKYVYAKGYKENAVKSDNKLLFEALQAADRFDKALVFAGLTDYVESEGCDRNDMSLPENQLNLINALLKKGKEVIVVLYLGSPVELPFVNGVKAILNMYLPGEVGGEATYSLLFGEKNPSGKLAETWVKSYKEVPYGNYFSKKADEIYKESIFVGYRYYLNHPEKILFPFGFGLSYSCFEYDDLVIKEEKDAIRVSVNVKNTSFVYGAEIVQIYVKAPNKVFRAQKELKGFAKVYLKPNEKKKVEIQIRKDDLRYWNIAEKRYVLEDGEYEIQACSNSMKVELSSSLNIQGENIPFPNSKNVEDMYRNSPELISDKIFEEMSGLLIPKPRKRKPITLESRFTDLKGTFIGKILFNAVLSVAKKQEKKAKKLPDGPERDNQLKGAFFLKRILESNSLITMTMSAGTSCPYNFAKGMMDLANGHIIRGVKDICSPIKVPPLPKDEREAKIKTQGDNIYGKDENNRS
ncbi:MAG TPA: glycosyl hydrolase [Firmicutes bacterium]|nr:glycosyl hydrolase [Bacillota bacterium]